MKEKNDKEITIGCFPATACLIAIITMLIVFVCGCKTNGAGPGYTVNMMDKTPQINWR